ncbi:MAG: coiled-coil domain-containing protein, partial [Olsenella sp.]
RRSLLFGAATAATWLGLLPHTALATPTSADLQSQLDEARTKLEDMGNNLTSMQDDLATAEETLENTKTQIMDTQDQIATTQADLDQKRSELSDNMRSSYKSGASSTLDFILGATSAEDLVSRIYYMDKVSDSQAAAIEDVKQLGEQLAEQETQLEEQQAEQEQNLADTQSSVDEYQAAVADAQAYYDSLDTQVQQALAEEAAAAQAAAEAAAAASTSTSDSTSTTSNTSTTASTSTSSGVSAVVSTVETTKSSESASSAVSSSTSGSYSASSSSNILSNAEQFIGWPYKCGCYGTNMGGFDCCGLVATAYHLAGYSTPYATNVPGLMSWVKGRGYWKDCNLSNYSSVLSVGDIIFCSTGHVAIYAGGNQMVHAPSPGGYVCYARVYACIGGGFGG